MLEDQGKYKKHFLDETEAELLKDVFKQKHSGLSKEEIDKKFKEAHEYLEDGKIKLARKIGGSDFYQEK